MLPSPKVRITEFLNILIEFVNKPYGFLIGKGILGSVKDYMGDIKMFNLGVYSYDEFVIQSYYSMHESVNIFFLSNGLFGLAFLFKYAKMFLRFMRNNPWIVIGSLWFLLLWGYSTTRAYLGLSCFILGLHMIDQNNNISLVDK